MLQKVKMMIASLILGATLLACTPEQVAYFQTLTPEKQTEVQHTISLSAGVCADAPSQSNCNLAWIMALLDGYTINDFACLDYIIMHESGWMNVPNAAGGRAYGIPQALPGSKMASHGADWHDNPRTQIAWLLDYVDGRYGTACKAKSFKAARGWY